MTTSSSERERKMVRRLVKLCSNQELERRIDMPLDRSLGAFRPTALTIRAPQDVIMACAALLCHLDREQFSASSAQISSARLIDEAFDGGLATHFRAFRDGTNGGVRALFLGVVERLKRERRDIYVRGVLGSAIDPNDGAQRLRLTSALLAEYSGLLPADIGSPEQLANRLPELVLEISAIKARLHRNFLP